jgi:hypothetical protein
MRNGRGVLTAETQSRRGKGRERQRKAEKGRERQGELATEVTEDTERKAGENKGRVKRFNPNH